MSKDNQYDWWLKALRGEREELTPGDPKSGFYRQGAKAIAIWRADGILHCEVSSGYQPRHADEIDGLFGFCSMNPITYDVYDTFIKTKKWPEDVSDDIEKARVGIGHNSALLHEQVQDEIEIIIIAFTSWLREIGGKISTEGQDKKGEEFKNRLLDLAKQVKDNHEREKKPFLEGGRAVDKAWKKPKDDAEDGKQIISAALTPYRLARQKLRDEAQQKVAEAAKVNDKPVPVVHPAFKPRTGLRTVRVAVIDDLKSAAMALASLENPPEGFIEAVRIEAKRLIEDCTPIAGVHIEEIKRA